MLVNRQSRLPDYYRLGQRNRVVSHKSVWRGAVDLVRSRTLRAILAERGEQRRQVAQVDIAVPVQIALSICRAG